MTWWQNLLTQAALATIQIFATRLVSTGQVNDVRMAAGAAQVIMAHVAKRSDPTT